MSQLPNDIPGNSHKAQEEAKKNVKPDIQPFEGEVAGVKRKKSGFWAWMRKMFLSDRKPSEIAMDVLENNIVPGIKDNFRNGIVSSLDMFIYQGSKSPSQSSANNNVQYNNIFRSPTTSKQSAPQQTQNNNGVDLSNGFSNPCFKTREDARRFLYDKLKSYDYPTLSVHTMYMMRSQHIDYTWDAYGWTKEEIASWDDKMIKHIDNRDWPWMIDLPQAHVIS